MGLAAYGEPAYLDEFRRIVRTNGGFGFRLGLEYFKHHRTGPEMSWSDSGKTPELGAMFSDHMAERLGPSRDPSAPVVKIHRIGAARLQSRLNDAHSHSVRALLDCTHEKT